MEIERAGREEVTVPQAQIHVVEVGPRDGFQMEATFLPTDLKVEVIDLLGKANLEKIEVTSFVSPESNPSNARQPAK